jgi:hypothetical protein
MTDSSRVKDIVREVLSGARRVVRIAPLRAQKIDENATRRHPLG